MINFKLFAVGNSIILFFALVGVLSFPIFYTPLKKSDYVTGQRTEGYGEFKAIMEGKDLTKYQTENYEKEEIENRANKSGQHNAMVFLLLLLPTLGFNYFIFRDTAIVKNIVKDFKEKMEHENEVEKEKRRAEILPLKANNQSTEIAMKMQFVKAELETDAGRIENDHLRARVNTVISGNSMSFAKVDLVKKITNAINFDAITDKQAELVLKILDPTVGVSDTSNQQLMAEQELERAIAENRKARAEARQKEYQADVDGFVRDETLRK